MKKTALFELHNSLGAKMVPFAGYYMPVQYDGVNTEHNAEEPQLVYLMFHIWGNLL